MWDRHPCLSLPGMSFVAGGLCSGGRARVPDPLEMDVEKGIVKAVLNALD